MTAGPAAAPRTATGWPSLAVQSEVRQLKQTGGGRVSHAAIARRTGVAEPIVRRILAGETAPLKVPLSLEGAVLLETIAEAPPEVSNRHLAGVTGDPVPAVMVLLDELERKGALIREGRGGGRRRLWPVIEVETKTPDRLRPALRRCLSCGEDFRSAHCGVRLCVRCKDAGRPPGGPAGAGGGDRGRRTFVPRN